MTAAESRRSVVDRYPVVSFAALALAFSWGVWVPTFTMLPESSWMPGIALGAFGPGAAAAVVTRLRGGSIRAWLADAFAWRRSLRWYLAALAIPAAVAGVMVVVTFGFVGEFDPAPAGQAVIAVAASLVLTTLAGGGQEELGWRGFALPHLQERFHALTSSVAIGALWAFWHAPMFVFGYYDDNPIRYAVVVISLAVLFTWYYNSSRGCLPGAILLHGAYNSSVNLPRLFVDVDALPVPYDYFWTAAFVLVALALTVAYGRETLSSGPAVLPTWDGRSGTTERESEQTAAAAR